MSGEGLLGDDEEREPFGPLAEIGVGPGQEGQNVRPAREGAPSLGSVDLPTLDAVDGGAVRAAFGSGHIAADIRFGHRDADHGLSRGELGQPVALLFLGAAAHERLGENLGSGDEGTCRCQRGPGQFLGCEDHGEIPHFDAAVFLGHRQAEEAELGHVRDELLGDEFIAAVDMLGVGHDLVGGEIADLLADLLVHFVQRVIVEASAGNDEASDLAAKGFAVGPSQEGSDFRREGGFHPWVADPEFLGGFRETAEQAGDELPHGSHRGHFQCGRAATLGAKGLG